MSALTPTAFRLRYSEFEAATYSDPVVQLAIDDATMETNSTIWGAFYERGVYALTAHFLASAVDRANGESSAGGVQYRAVGDVIVTFGRKAGALDELGGTTYGCEYVRLRSKVSGGPVVC
jgi:hypothetical protein